VTLNPDLNLSKYICPEIKTAGITKGCRPTHHRSKRAQEIGDGCRPTHHRSKRAQELGGCRPTHHRSKRAQEIGDGCRAKKPQIKKSSGNKRRCVLV